MDGAVGLAIVRVTRLVEVVSLNKSLQQVWTIRNFVTVIDVLNFLLWHFSRVAIFFVTVTDVS